MGFREIADTKTLKWVILSSIGLLVIGLVGFNYVLELRAAEGRRALVTFEMLYGDGDVLTPYLHGYLYFNKPPFYNWIIAIFFELFGSIREWVVRLPGVLSLLATAAGMYFYCKRYVSPRVALLSGAMFLTITDLLFYGSVNAGEIDLFYAFLTMAQVVAIFHFTKRQQWLWMYTVSYTLMAIGFLTKGLPSIAFQGLTLVVYLATERHFRRLFSWQHAVGGALAILIGGGYFYLYAENGGDAISYLVMTFKQASQRSANEYPLSKIIGNLFVFPFDIARRLLPWSLALVFLLSKNVRRSLWENKLLRFLVIFTAANILVYWTAPELRIRYMYMFFPVFAMLFAHLIDRGVDELPKWRNGLEVLFLISLALAGFGSLLGPWFTPLLLSEKLIVAVTGALILGTVWRSRTYRGSLNFYWFLVFALAVARMGFNLVGLPFTDRQLPDYEGMTLEMIDKADEQPIHFYDQPMIIWPQVSFFGDTLYQKKVKIPDDFTSGFPYYYAIHTGQVMDLRSNSETGHTYLLFDFRKQPEHEIILDFPNMIGGRKMIFCKVKPTL